jgi:hypothetical protein
MVEQVGWFNAAWEVGVARWTLRAAFQRWVGVGGATAWRPARPSRLVVDRAAAEEALEMAVQVGVNRATLYQAWRQWWLRPIDRVEGARPAYERSRAATPGRRPSMPGGGTARSGGRGGRPDLER